MSTTDTFAAAAPTAAADLNVGQVQFHLSERVQRQLQTLHDSTKACRLLESLMRGFFATELLRALRAKEAAAEGKN